MRIHKLHFSPRRVNLILLLLCSFFVAGCGEKPIATAHSEFEAVQIFDILHSRGFQIKKNTLPGESGEPPRFELVIDEGYFGEGEAAAAIQILRDYGLPRPPDVEPKTGDALGIVSEREERARQTRDLQILIERQLYTLPDVIRASVIIAQPTDDILTIEKTPPTASISLVIKEQQAKFTIPDVQNLVAGSVPKLKPDNVKVAVSQQLLRDISMDKFAATRRSNAIFALGIGVVALLAAALGAVWFIPKWRRKKNADDYPAQIEEREEPAQIERSDRAELPPGDE